jgi:hypothetical protein
VQDDRIFCHTPHWASWWETSALSTPLIYASPDKGHTGEHVKLKMQESIVEMFTTGMQECASTVKITQVEMQWKLNEKEAKIKTTKAKA